MNQKLLDLYKKTAELTGTKPEQVEAVLSEMWYGVRTEISKSQGNNVLIHYLGTFEIPKGLISKYLESMEKSYRNGNMTKAKYEKGLESLTRIKQQNES